MSRARAVARSASHNGRLVRAARVAVSALALALVLAPLHAADAAAPPRTVADAGDDALAAVAPSGDGAFLVLRECVVLDAIGGVPSAVATRPLVPLADYLAALGPAKPAFEITNDRADVELIRLAADRWLVVQRYRSFVRPSAVAAIDERTASGLLLPPTPAPGADAGKPLVTPLAQAIGVTVAAGTARIFCGVRSNGRTLAVRPSDLQALAALMRVPTADDLAATVAQRLGATR